MPHPAPKPRARPTLVHQFLIVLSGTDPLVWRRIQAPERYSFWDLHVAIQDAMGWLDYHLHEFRLLDRSEKQVVSIGIPTDDDPEDRPVIPSWTVRVSRYFERRAWHAPPALYAYDFGNDWEHVLVHEGMESAEESVTYPRCVAGARRCPPEDCGGVHGYAEFLRTISDRRHPEHQSTLEWVGGAYDPDAFDPHAVVFDDPRKRFRKAFNRRRRCPDGSPRPSPRRPRASESSRQSQSVRPARSSQPDDWLTTSTAVVIMTTWLDARRLVPAS